MPSAITLRAAGHNPCGEARSAARLSEPLEHRRADMAAIADGTREILSAALEAERAATDPKVFTKIHMHFTVRGHKLSASAVERAIAMSHEKYCSASAMLAKTAEMTTSFELVEDVA